MVHDLLPDAHLTLLYVSKLSPGMPDSTAADIAAQSRPANERRHITGLLIFDGARFTQLVEGPEEGVRELWESLQRDRRHTDIELLFMAYSGSVRRFPSWHLGYLPTTSQEASIALLEGKRSLDALLAFDAMLPHLDAAIGSASPGDVPPVALRSPNV